VGEKNVWPRFDAFPTRTASKRLRGTPISWKLNQHFPDGLLDVQHLERPTGLFEFCSAGMVPSSGSAIKSSFSRNSDFGNPSLTPHKPIQVAPAQDAESRTSRFRNRGSFCMTGFRVDDARCPA